jgi:hypothetical protein
MIQIWQSRDFMPLCAIKVGELCHVVNTIMNTTVQWNEILRFSMCHKY